ncbi:protoporphyrinogen/coproporphyrinogen oxidase [Candidatus Pyrohabitans sp.]
MQRYDKECVVIGGGISGLVSAYELAKRGYKVIILEKEKRLGGRLYPFIRGEFRADAGAQLIGENYNYTLNLLKDLGCKNELVRIKEPSASIFINRKIYSLDGMDRVIDKKDIFNLINEIYKLGNKYNLSFTNIKIKNKNLLNLSIADWINKYFNENVLEYLVQPSITGLTLTEPEKLSALYGLTLLYSDLKFSYSIKNGLSNIINILINKLYQYNIDIKTNCHVYKISEVNDEFEIDYKNKNKFFTIKTKNLICSTPAFVTSNLLQYNKNLKFYLSKIKYSYGIQILIALNKRIWKDSWAILIPRKELKDIAMIIESTLASPLTVPKGRGLMELFIYGETANKLSKYDKCDIFKFILDILNNLFPNINIAKEIIWYDIIIWNYVIPIHSPNFVELLSKINMNTNNNIIIAGDYLYLPSIEAAVYSGYNAVKQIETKTQSKN